MRKSNVHAFKMKSTGESSAKLGACEVCKKHADTMYLLTIYKGYHSSQKGTDSYSHVGSLFGHNECLAKMTDQVCVTKTSAAKKVLRAMDSSPDGECSFSEALEMVVKQTDKPRQRIEEELSAFV